MSKIDEKIGREVRQLIAEELMSPLFVSEMEFMMQNDDAPMPQRLFRLAGAIAVADWLCTPADKRKLQELYAVSWLHEDNDD